MGKLATPIHCAYISTSQVIDYFVSDKLSREREREREKTKSIDSSNEIWKVLRQLLDKTDLWDPFTRKPDWTMFIDLTVVCCQSVQQCVPKCFLTLNYHLHKQHIIWSWIQICSVFVRNCFSHLETACKIFVCKNKCSKYHIGSGSEVIFSVLY